MERVEGAEAALLSAIEPGSQAPSHGGVERECRFGESLRRDGREQHVCEGERARVRAAREKPVEEGRSGALVPDDEQRAPEPRVSPRGPKMVVGEPRRLVHGVQSGPHRGLGERSARIRPHRDGGLRNEGAPAEGDGRTDLHGCSLPPGSRAAQAWRSASRSSFDCLPHSGKRSKKNT